MYERDRKRATQLQVEDELPPCKVGKRTLTEELPPS